MNRKFTEKENIGQSYENWPYVYMKTFRLNINQGNEIKTRHHFTPNILVKRKK